MVVDDTDWRNVAGAIEDYLVAQPRATRLLEVRGKAGGQPWWWEGMQVLVWTVPASTSSSTSSL